MPNLTDEVLAKIKEKIKNIKIPADPIQHTMELVKLIENAKTIAYNNDAIFDTFSEKLSINGGDESRLENDAKQLFEKHEAIDKAITVTLYSYAYKYFEASKERNYDNYLTKEVINSLQNQNEYNRFLADYQIEQIQNIENEDVEIDGDNKFNLYYESIQLDIQSKSKIQYARNNQIAINKINKTFPDLNSKMDEWKHFDGSPKLEGKINNNLEDYYSDIKNICDDSNASYYDTIQAELKSCDNAVLESKNFKDNALTNSFKNDRNYYITLKNKEEALLGSYAFIMDKRKARTFGDILKSPIAAIKDYFLSKKIANQLTSLNYKQSDLDALYNKHEEKNIVAPIQEEENNVKTSSNTKEKTNELRNDLEKSTTSPELNIENNSSQKIINEPNKNLGENTKKMDNNK